MGIVGPDVVDRADVRMIERGGRFGFALEPGERDGIASDVWRQKFERNETVETNVLSLVHHPHAAAARLLEDSVVRDRLADKGDGIRPLWASMLGLRDLQVNGGAVASLCLPAERPSSILINMIT